MEICGAVSDEKGNKIFQKAPKRPNALSRPGDFPENLFLLGEQIFQKRRKTPNRAAQQKSAARSTSPGRPAQVSAQLNNQLNNQLNKKTAHP